jgi:hypothetical protein
MVPLFSIKKSQKKLSTVCPGGFVRSDDRLHQMNQNLRLFHEGVGMMFLVEEVCGGKCLVDKCPSFYLYVAFLVIIHWVLGFPEEHLQGSGSLRRGGVLTETGSMSPVEWGIWSENQKSESRHGVCRTRGGQGSWSLRGFWATLYRCGCLLNFPSNAGDGSVELGDGGRGR